MEYYKKGYNLGYPLCKYSLGISYELGLGNALPIDEEKGNKLLQQAYPQIISLINSQDIGTDRNYRLSEHYLRIAKEAGLKRAINKYEEYEYGEER